jgi:protein-tyrosine phosphatase
MTDSPVRHLNLAGASNFRDLGGYPAQGGRTVRWRQLFRSNHLGHLTDNDVVELRRLGLKSVFDLRGVEERATAVCAVSDIAVHSLPIEPAIMKALAIRHMSGKPLTAAEAADMVRDSYRNYVSHNTPRFRTLFGHLLESRAPLVIHCTAGKDRTGFAVALVLGALGVADDVIAEDYLLTNRHYRIDAATARSIDLPDDVKAILISVDTTFLAAAFATVQSEYGSLDRYFEEGLGVGPRERAALAALYLEP